MHYFKYHRNELYCENVRVADILKKTGTPAYIYSSKTFASHVRKLQKAFRRFNPLICYSMKANSNLAVLKTMLREGAGLDIVSGGELYRAKCVECPPEKIVYAGVGKTAEEIAEALRYGILFFNVESEPELEMIDRVARDLRKLARVSLRINPDVDPRTHHHIATGKKESKFGLDLETAEKIFRKRQRFSSVSFCAIHVHIGSQILFSDPFVEAFRKTLAFIDEIEKRGAKIEYLNLGGGLGVIYCDERPQTAQEFAKKIAPLFAGRKLRLIFEPGRFIVANGGILCARTLYVKQTPTKNFAIVDAAMNDLIRPSLYDAYHAVWPLEKKPQGATAIYDVVGPVCESGDFFAKGRELQKMKAGDAVAIMTAGAYGFTMSSNYNARPRACEVLVHGSRWEIVRKREALEDLAAGETIPDFF
ncbi:MAG: diaminopimelate decarboxylase [Candidatus Omnitrophota bacterium]|jgi:diaminopimelate decarboxylase